MVRVAAAIWGYLEGLALHRLFVLGFCRKRRCIRSEQSMSVLDGLGPIDLILDDQRFTCLEGLWTTGLGVAHFGGGMQAEIAELRQDRRRLRKELEKYVRRSQEMNELREKLNLLDFKYQLLLDMWTSRTDGQQSPTPSESEPPPPAPPPSTVHNVTTTVTEQTTTVQQLQANLSST